MRKLLAFIMVITVLVTLVLTASASGWSASKQDTLFPIQADDPRVKPTTAAITDEYSPFMEYCAKQIFYKSTGQAYNVNIEQVCIIVPNKTTFVNGISVDQDTPYIVFYFEDKNTSQHYTCFGGSWTQGPTYKNPAVTGAFALFTSDYPNATNIHSNALTELCQGNDIDIYFLEYTLK